MPVANKTASSFPTSMAPSVIPEFPNVVPSLLEVSGMQEQNARWQEWWNGVRQQLFKEGQATGIKLARGQILVSEEAAAREEADGFLEGKYTLTVQAGDVVTGMEITSSTGPNAGTVSQVSFRADKFMIYTGSTNKEMFVADAGQDKVRLAGVLTVDRASGSVYIKTTAGSGSYNNSGTPWYVDDTGRMSLKDKLTWDGSALTINGSVTASTGTIGGWTIGSTTLTGGNATLDSAGQLFLGTGNDIVYLSATNATYRMWVGNATAGSAAFNVTKAGILTATGATITGGVTFASTNRVIATDNGSYLTWQGDTAINVPGFYAQHETNAGGGFASLGVGTNAPSVVFLSRARGSFGALSTITTDDRIGTVGFTAYNGSSWNTYGNLVCGISNSTSTPFVYLEADTALTMVLTTGKMFFSASGGPLNIFGGPTYMSDPNANFYRSATGTMKTDGNFHVGGALRINNARAAGAPVAGGTVQIQDSTGATVNVLVV